MIIECYRFVTPSGDVLLTSYPKPVYHETDATEVEVFEPAQVSRSAIEVSAALDSIMTNDITVPSDHPLAIMYAYGQSPQTFRVEIYETEDEGETLSTIWVGELNSIVASLDTVVFKTISVIQSEVNANPRPVLYQSLCNHQLYDSRCKVDRNDYTVTATVTKVEDIQITVNDTVYPNDSLNLGTILNLASGEARSIINNTDNVIQVTYPFINIEVGDTVELSLGCDHARLGSCKNTFNNVTNYGGFDFVPVNNPFETDKV